MPEKTRVPQESMLEPWLRGSLAGFDPVISHLLRSSEHIRQDIDHWFGGRPEDELWQCRAGFHLNHLAGSTERLCTYLAGTSLNDRQIAEAAQELEPRADVLQKVGSALSAYEDLVKKLAPIDFASTRRIGRRRIEVTAISLAIHIAEHGQRHLGQAIESFRDKNSI